MSCLEDATPDELKVNEVNANVYFFDAETMYRALDLIDNHNAAGEFYLTDTISIIGGWGLQMEVYLVADPLEMAGINDPEQLKELEAEYLRRQGKTC
jgi:bifunctional UDP-N-acetylglucosamine pyrophosphorylase/glucosamine-1-phosphate N-acetyltransferase